MLIWPACADASADRRDVAMELLLTIQTLEKDGSIDHPATDG